MVILDTDHMSLLEREPGELGRRIERRLDQLGQSEWATTIVSYEEQLRGWLALLARARKVVSLVEAYGRLKVQFVNYSRLIVLDFDEHAAVQYQRLTKAKLRIGVMDMRIAAIALSNNGTVLTRNLSDFQKVPGLKVEDWTREEKPS